LSYSRIYLVTDALRPRSWYDGGRQPGSKTRLLLMGSAMTHNQTATALIVDRPDALRSGLQALMATILSIEIVGVASDVAEAQGTISQRCPDLLLLDASLPGGEAPLAIQTLRIACPQTRCVVLADDVEQQQAAESAGADVVLLKGVPAAKLVATIEDMLAGQAATTLKDK
jgi:DNA-binding NarL/FixJ family response regulator